MPQNSLQIFIAHASEDKPQVKELYAKLVKAGYKPWLDEEDLFPGQNWSEEIPKALKNSDLFIACLSSTSISKRGYIQKEFKMAMEKLAELPQGEIYLIPLKFDDCTMPELRQSEYGLNLKDIQWLDYWKPNGFEKLVKSIEYHLESKPANIYSSAPESKAWSRFDWLWEAFTIVILIVNFSLVTELITRFLRGGLDPLGAFAIIMQGLIAVLAAGGTLTTVGRNVIDRALENLRIPPYFHHEVKLGLAVCVFCCLLFLHASLPFIADFYVDRGLREQRQYQFASALENYRRATELDPNNMEAHYYLGNSYEQLQQLDEARISYQIAVSGNLTQAFNNLGRLYIVKDQDYAAAASLLMQGLQQNVDNDQLRAILLKNLGWARLGQKRYSEAQANLEEALHINKQLNKQQASPHCLLAQVLEAQGKKAIALNYWQNCSDYTNGQNPDEDRWFGLAQQRLNSENRKQ